MTRFAADRPLRLAPATALDYRELARRRLPRQLFDYVDGGAYDEATMRSNGSALPSDSATTLSSRRTPPGVTR